MLDWRQIYLLIIDYFIYNIGSLKRLKWIKEIGIK